MQAVIQVESAYQERARSPKGAMGLMQLMPATARQYAVADPYDPRVEHRGGHQAPEVAARAVPSCRWRSPPTTPARRRSSASAAFRLPGNARLRRARPAARRPVADPSFSALPDGLILAGVARSNLQGGRGAEAWYNFGPIMSMLTSPCGRSTGTGGRLTVEFRCRLASPNGEIVEGVYVADSEARLRHELEEKGLFVLSLQPKGPIAGLSRCTLPQRRRRSPRASSWSSTRNWRRCSRRACRWSSRSICSSGASTSPVFRSVLDDVHEKVRSGTALSDAFAAHGDAVSARLHGVAAGRRAQRQPRRGAAALRRVREDHRDGEAQDRLGAGLSRRFSSSLALVLVVDHRAEGRAGVLRLLRGFGAELPLVDARSSSASRTSSATQFLLLVVGARRRRSSLFVVLGPAAGPAGALRSPAARACRCSATIARKFATSQMARTLATLLGGGLPLVNALDIAAQVDRQPVHGRRSSTIVSARVREGRVVRGGARGARASFPDVAVKMAEVGESTGALQDMLNTVADFYDEEIATNMERFVTLVEPVLLVVMGIVIAGLLLALYMPLFQLSSVLAQ